MTDTTQAPTTVRGAVEKASAAPAKVTPDKIAKDHLRAQKAWLEQVLPPEVDLGRFSQLVLTAVKNTPRLMECFGSDEGELSFLLAVKEAAEVGLEPNTPLQECWLLPRRKGKVMECELQIGYIGWLKLIRRSGEIQTIFAEVVREGDEFHYARGLDRDDFVHVVAEERGDLTHAYAVARYLNGGYSFVVLTRGDVETRRDSSESWRSESSRPYSPWTKWPEAMWRKSAIRALRPYLPLSAQAARTLSRDEQVLTISDADVTEVVIADTPELDEGS